ncbi:MAG: ABC transporter substrate-binding protein [Saprospiraceae bacterium]|nr:ABC transporter substrate-binding protein [Saprospiraceae bacterium]
MNNFFTTRRVIIAAAILLAAWLLYPFLFGKKKVRAPEEVTVRVDAAAITFNSYLSNGHGPSSFVTRQTLQTLGELDPKSLKMQPLLITGIPKVRIVNDGPKKGQYAYDFEIIPEASWDNGSPITAKDVEFTLKIIFHPGLPTKSYHGFLNKMTGLEIDPANPKKFTVYYGSFYMLALETLCSIPIYPAYNYDASNRLVNIALSDLIDTTKTAALAEDPNVKAFVEDFSQPKFANDPNAISGSGPYRMELMNEQGTVMVKKQNWWGDKVADKYPMLAAYPQKLVYKVVKDDPTLENRLRNGELDLAGGSITPSKFLEFKADSALSKKYDFFALGTVQYNRWLLNHRHPILGDVQVRRALAHIVDYDYFVQQVQRGLAVRTAVPLPPTLPYYNKTLPLPDYNVAKARQILNQAGWTDLNGDGILDKVINGRPTPLSFKLSAPMTSKINELMANSLKESARQAGIDLQLVAVDIAVLSADTRNGNYDSALLGVSMFPGWIEFYQRFHSKSFSPAGDNRTFYANAEADRLIEAIRAEPDEAKRMDLYREVQKVFYDDLPEIPLYTPLQRIIISKKFEPGLETENRPGYWEHFARLKPE